MGRPTRSGRSSSGSRPAECGRLGGTAEAIHDCGLQAAFDWTETVNNGKVYYQTPVHRIEPGDIILMHFRPAFVSDVTAALTAIHQAGLTPARPENYVK